MITKDPCVLPVDTGSCSNYQIFWYFNQVDRECVQFYYGGCDGNQNRFESRHTCEISCKISKEDRAAISKLPFECRTPLEYGNNCEQPSTKWYFDFQSKICYSFDYTGCGVNDSNRFETNEDCNNVCVETLYNQNKTNETTEFQVTSKIEIKKSTGQKNICNSIKNSNHHSKFLLILNSKILIYAS